MNLTCMKARWLIIATIVTVPLGSFGQGTLNFSNLAGVGTRAVDAPVTNAAGIRIVGPGPYVADLFWSSNTNSSVDSLTPAGFDVPFSTSTLYGGGYFIGASRTLPAVAWILAQVRVWDTTYGASYAQARDAGGEFGSSNPIIVLLTIPPGPPADLLGLQGFQLERIPEPTAAALTLIGGAALWLCRRMAYKAASARERK